MDDHLATDTATRHHSVYFRLRFWNDGGGGITPEVRVTKVLLGDDVREAKFSPQLPLLLPWSSLAAPPTLTRLHTGGETVGVLGALNWADKGDGTGTGYPIDPPLMYVAGEEHTPEIGQTDEKVLCRFKPSCPVTWTCPQSSNGSGFRSRRLKAERAATFRRGISMKHQRGLR